MRPPYPRARSHDDPDGVQVLEEAGVPSYWLVDPEALTIRVLEIEDGVYVERGTVTGSAEPALSQPFPVVLTAAALGA